MTYEDNTKQVIANIQLKLKKASDVSKLQRTIATYLLQSNWERISRGQGVNRVIGRYNTTKPLYVNPKKAVRSFGVAGKTGKSKFLNGNSHKTKYFSSYKDFRTKVGRETSVVNLQLSGKLRRDWAIEQDGKDWVIGFRSQYGSDISRGNEKNFHTQIFGVSQKETQQIKEIEQDFIKECLK